MVRRVTAGLRALLAHPLARGVDLDAPTAALAHRRIIRSKAFLSRLYREWYRDLAAELPPGPGPALELGSGGGFMAEVIPELITSDVFACPGLNLCADGRHLPVASASLRGILMVDVLHHVPQPELLLAEAARCVLPGGVLAMIEPWVTRWSRLVFGGLHHEGFDPHTPGWFVPAGGPLSAGNGALAWMMLERDRARFERECGEWRIECIVPFMPLSYLLSGGLSMRSLMPGWSYPCWRRLESWLGPLEARVAMFARIVLRRVAV